MTITKLCPCGSNSLYLDCCSAYHAGLGFAPTPEKLMRSRYSAFALLLEPYLLATWHASTRPLSLNLKQEERLHPKKWLSLKVIYTEQKSPEQGLVEFVAKYKINGKAYTLHEVSDFVLEDNKWFYVSGILD